MRILSLFSLLLFILTEASGQSNVDDNILKQAIESRDGYMLRRKDERYEGLYTRNVNGEVVEVVSLTYGSIQYELKDKESITIKSSINGKYKEIGVTGCSFNLDKNYHLNMLLKSGGKKTIPLDEVINRNYIYEQNLGIYGYVGRPAEPDLYIPVSVTSRISNHEAANPVQLILISNLDLVQVRWKYAADNNGTCFGYNEPMAVDKKGPVFQKSKPIVINLSNLTPGREICVAVETKTSADAKWVTKNFKVLIPAK